MIAIALLLALQNVPDHCASIHVPKETTIATTYRFGRVSGQAIFSIPGQQWETGALDGMCVGLFDARSGALTAAVTTKQGGELDLDSVPSGRYVLVGYFEGMQTLSVPIEVVRNTSNHGVLLHMRAADDRRSPFVTVIANQSLRRELLAMLDEDQALRAELIARGVDKGHPEIEGNIAAASARFVARLKEIVAQYGWPSSDLAGFDGSRAAFFIVQHADLETQQSMLPMIRDAFRSGDLSGELYALLVDRVLVLEGKKQLYGSAAKPFNEWKNREPEFEPIEDPANLDARRAQLGIGPFAEYIQNLRRLYFPPSP